ncbi:MAG: ferrous iron transport protein A [Lachnospiraceae bacterium]|nr:ferrous iron transport protein A [Lachnospiraceae bacterium]
MIPLSVADRNVLLTVRRVTGKPDVRQHLETLGFVAGATIQIVAETCGNVIVNVKDSRIAISDEAARHIFV